MAKFHPYDEDVGIVFPALLLTLLFVVAYWHVMMILSQR